MKHITEFDHRIRDEWLRVEAEAWQDETGIYKTAVKGVYLDGVNVTGLLTSYDLAEIDMEIAPAVLADLDDDRVTAFNPDKDAFRIGD